MGENDAIAAIGAGSTPSGSAGVLRPEESPTVDVIDIMEWHFLPLHFDQGMIDIPAKSRGDGLNDPHSSLSGST